MEPYAANIKTLIAYYIASYKPIYLYQFIQIYVRVKATKKRQQY